MFRYVRKRTSASVTWCLPCRRPSVRASAAGQAVGGRVPQALRHIENLLRQAPQRRVRPRRHRREQEIPQGHRQGRRERKAARLCPVTSHRFPIQDTIIRQQECAILLKASSVAHCCYMHFPHRGHIGALRVKLNFASETEERERPKHSTGSSSIRTRN